MSGKAVKERLKAFIDYKRLTQETFAISIGVSSGYMGAMRKGPSIDVLNNIAIEYPELNIEWLVIGRGEMLLKSKVDEDVSIAAEPSPEYGTRKDKVDQALAGLSELMKSQQKAIEDIRNSLADLDKKNTAGSA